MIAALFAATLTAATALAAPASSPAPAASPASIASPSSSHPTAAMAVVWQNVTLGEPTSDVLARLGAPTSRRKAIMGTYLLDYEALGGAGTLSLTDGGGVVTGIRLIAADPSNLHLPPADPFGVSLGDSADRLTELRGQPQRYDDEGDGEFTSYYGKASEVRWAYGLRNGVIFSIGVISAYRIVRASGAAVSVPTPRPSNAPSPPPPDASAFDRAVRVTADDLDADPQFEYTFVRRIACGAGDRWSPSGQTFINAHKRNYLRIDAVCPSTGELRSFYFDITAVFGRGER